MPVFSFLPGAAYVPVSGLSTPILMGVSPRAEMTKGAAICARPSAAPALTTVRRSRAAIGLIIHSSRTGTFSVRDFGLAVQRRQGPAPARDRGPHARRLWPSAAAAKPSATTGRQDERASTPEGEIGPAWAVSRAAHAARGRQFRRSIIAPRAAARAGRNPPRRGEARRERHRAARPRAALPGARAGPVLQASPRPRRR